LAEFDAIEGEDDFVPLGTLPSNWVDARTMGSAGIDGVFADIYGVAWVSQLRRTLAGEALRLGMKDIDLSSLERAEPRRLTQLASREAYLLSFAGVFYRSRYGQTLENWVIFEPFPLEHATSKEFSKEDPDLREALRLHGIRLV
jgi:hypothetical protein